MCEYVSALDQVASGMLPSADGLPQSCCTHDSLPEAGNGACSRLSPEPSLCLRVQWSALLTSRRAASH